MDNLSKMLADIDELANDPDPSVRPTPYAVNRAKSLLIETANLMGANPQGHEIPQGTVSSEGVPGSNSAELEKQQEAE